MKRAIWTVRPAKLVGWNLTRQHGTSERVEWFAFKFMAVRMGRRCCRDEWERFHIPSELMIANRKGRYTAEGSTYGDDPRESKG